MATSSEGYRGGHSRVSRKGREARLRSRKRRLTPCFIWAPFTMEAAPSRMPPSGKIPTTRPSLSLLVAMRRAHGQDHCARSESRSLRRKTGEESGLEKVRHPDPVDPSRKKHRDNRRIKWLIDSMRE